MFICLQGTTHYKVVDAGAGHFTHTVALACSLEAQQGSDDGGRCKLTWLTRLTWYRHHTCYEKNILKTSYKTFP